VRSEGAGLRNHLDDVDAENGCMRYIPRSHASGSIYRHRVSDRDGIVLNQELEPSAFDASLARDDCLKSGWCRGRRMISEDEGRKTGTKGEGRGIEDVGRSE
jgi:hypothetical protein